MHESWSRAGAIAVACFMSTAVPHASAAAEEDAMRELVAISIVADGRAIILATPGLPRGGRTWRFRSLDTADLPQPVRSVTLSASGTKLFIQAGAGPGSVLDLTRQYRHQMSLQYVSVGDLAVEGRAPRHSHRLPAQRFVSVQDGKAFVVDDTARVVPDYPVLPAVRGSIAADGTALFVRSDGVVTVCGEDATNRGTCRELPGRVAPEHGDVAASAAAEPARSAISRTEASLRASLKLHRLSMPEARLAREIRTLVDESAATAAAQGEPQTDWTFFHVSVETELYAPVLELSRLETVFPGSFETLEELAAGISPRAGQPLADLLFDRYLRRGPASNRARCNYYVTAHSVPGSWIVEYWLYYPFDVGGLGAHPHDPEHIFVEVDKLGGGVRRVIGAGHGYMAGNNVFTAGRTGAQTIPLPLFAIAELGKHASAPDIDRDGVFTPGIDENEYNERAKVWGVRDVIGTINNELMAYDTTMSGLRRASEYLALAALANRFPDEPEILAAASCRLTPLPAVPAHDQRGRLSDWILLPPCHELTTGCARLHVTAHPDFLDVRTILKEWNFPSSFLRAVYGLGPRRGLHSVGLGYAMDMDRVPGLARVLPLPGRLGIDAFYWKQPASTPASRPSTGVDDRDSCPRRTVVDGETYCPVAQGFGWGLRYEQFLSNLFGIYSSVRLLSPPLGDAWIAFGPFMEAPIGRRSNAMIQGGLAFRPYESPRFELRLSVGLWKPKTNHVGIGAGSDKAR